MAEYNKISNKTQDKDINYLNKDFNSFKQQLMDFAQVYFPNTFNDFSEANYGLAPQVTQSINEEVLETSGSNSDNLNTEGLAYCYNADAIKITLTYTFPTVTTSGQEINLNFDYRVKFKLFDEPFLGLGSNHIAYWPHEDWDASWSQYKFIFFGVCIAIGFIGSLATFLCIGASTIPALLSAPSVVPSNKFC